MKDENQMEFANASLRMPADLKAAVERRAQANRRSLNSEIVVMLEGVIASESEKSSASADDTPATEEPA